LSLETTAFRGEGLENIPTVEALDLSETEVDDEAAQKLADLHQLRDLYLFDTKISDDGLRHLSGLENLEHLSLSRVSDRGLRHLAPLKQLRTLRIDGEGITDEAVPLLKRFPLLEDLAIGDSSISESGRAELRAAVPNCNIW
jgi:internalin A